MRKSLGVVAGCGLLAASIVVLDAVSPGRAEAAGLTAFDSCDAAVGYLKEQAEAHMGPYGPTDRALGVDPGIPEATGRETAAAEDSAGVSGGSDAGSVTPEHSATNVQEVGVDEPDVVKTDGEILVTGVDEQVRIYDVTGTDPRELSTVNLPDGAGRADLLLAGDTLLVFSLNYVDDWREDRMPLLGGHHGTVTVVQQVDISDPSAPRVAGTLELDAMLVDARRSDDRVSLVATSEPTVRVPVDPSWYGDFPSTSELDEQQARNEKTVQESETEAWLPGYRLEVDGETSSGTLVDCDRLHRPDDFPGFGLVSVVTFDLDAPLSAEDTTAVLSGGDIVYATADTLYVTTTEFDGPIAMGGVAADIAPRMPIRTATGIHAFALTDGPATYLASGTVQGGVKDRFALSEHDGVLRVATTLMDDDRETQSQVVTLERDGRNLVELGSVGGLGKNEDIYAVRYLGDTAYVVTFRRTDPLYVVDLSDPRRPRATGELKITGYSGYLHDVGDGRLVGVGQEATSDGRTVGAQVSLFDVSDPTDPRKVDGHVVDGGWTDAEIDPHAFLFWARSGQLVIPISGERPHETGSLVLRVGTDSVDEQGFVAYAGPERDNRNDSQWWGPSATRNVVVGDRLFTVWENGLQVSSLSTLEPGGFATFHSS